MNYCLNDVQPESLPRTQSNRQDKLYKGTLRGAWKLFNPYSFFFMLQENIDLFKVKSNYHENLIKILITRVRKYKLSTFSSTF